MSLGRYPPGALLVLNAAPKQLLPLAPVFIAHKYLRNYLPYHIPGYAWAAAYVFAIPVVAVIKGVIHYIQEEREIKKLGARRVPRVKAERIGGLDLLRHIIVTFTHGYMGDILQEWTANGKTAINITILWGLVPPWIFTVEPDHIKEVLAGNFDNYEKGSDYHSLANSILGSGVFNSDGDRWKYHRAMTRPFFARDRVTDFDIFNHHTDIVVAKLKERFLEGEPIDFQDIVSRFTLDAGTEFLFGACVNSLEAALPYAWNSPRNKAVAQPHSSDKFTMAFIHAQERMALRLRLFNVWPWLELWGDDTKESMKVIHNYVDPILRKGLARKAAQKNDAPAEKAGTGATTLLDHLLEHSDDFDLIRDQIVNVMMAGRDTTMAAITYMAHCLAQNPYVLARLREEILTNVGASRRPTMEDIKECKYLRAVINETLRLYPVVPFNLRRSKKATTWPSPEGGKPLYIPAKMDIPFSAFLMHRRTDLWGPDADKFDPDRFLDARLQKYLLPNPYIFLPFNAGPRICLGQQYAYNEISFIMIRILQEFDTITLVSDAQPPETRPPESWKSKPGTQGTDAVFTKCHLSIYAHGGLWLKMRPAQQRDTV